jgi:hypothetical protein
MELVRENLGYKDLSRLLEGIGVSIEPRILTNKVARGTFSFVFFLQCMHVLKVETVHLKIPESPKSNS